MNINWLSDILNILKEDDESIKRKKERNLFEKEFWKRRISKYDEEFIEKIVDYWFDNFMKKYSELWMSYKNHNLKVIFHNSFDLTKEEISFNEEYEKFSNEYWERFLNSKEKTMKRLCSYWFENFKNKLKEKYWIDENEYRLSRILYFFTLTKEEFEYQTLCLNYHEFFWNKFSLLDSKSKEEIINMYEDPKDFYEKIKKNWIRVSKNSNLYYDVFLLSLLNKEECEIEIEKRYNYEKFKKEYWYYFSSLKEERRNELSLFWYKNFLKEVKKREWLKWKDFSITRNFYNKTEEDYKEYLMYKESVDFWINLMKFNKEKIELVKSTWISNLMNIVNRRWLSSYDRWIHIIICELMYWLRINNEKDKYICHNCWYKKRLSILTEQRMCYWDPNKICERCFPKNYTVSSFWERELFEFIHENFTWKIISWSRVIEDSKWNKWKREIDIHLIHKNIWFEYNWTYFHWTELSKKRDFEKLEQAKKQWIKIYTVNEKDWKEDKENEKRRIINILKKEWIFSPRNINEISKIKSQRKFKDLNYTLSQLDNEFEIERFKEFFWNEIIENLSDEFKDELKLFWFHEVEIRMKNRKISKEFINLDFEKHLRRYVLIDNKNYEFNKEVDKFIKEFWKDFQDLNMFHKEKLVYFWFEDFVKSLKELNWDYSDLRNAYTKITRRLYKDVASKELI